MSSDRRPLYGLLVLGGLIVACFIFALVVLYHTAGEEGENETGPKIGIVQIQGVIDNSRKGIEDLRKFRKDRSIRAIVVRIDSPGGAVGPSQELYLEVKRTRKVKPVVASLGAIAASGGFYIAAGCDKIVSSAGTITGSIGVISQTTHFPELLNLAHIQTHTFKSGEFKDTGSPLRDITERERTYLQSFVDEVYQQFLRDVANGRKLNETQIKPIADGRILTGEQALSHHLVDQIGNFSDALELAAQLARAKGEPVPVYPRSRKGLLAELFSDSLDSLSHEMRQLLSRSNRIEVREPNFQ
jgi:protease-4